MGCRKGKQPTEKSALEREGFQKFYLPYIWVTKCIEKGLQGHWPLQYQWAPPGEEGGKGECIHVWHGFFLFGAIDIYLVFSDVLSKTSNVLSNI